MLTITYGEFMPKILPLFAFVAPFLVLTGCAVTDTEISVTKPEWTYHSDAKQTVFINMPVDKRIFDASTKDPSIPSTDPSTLAVGRKRNGWGKAMGSFTLPKEQGVDNVIKQSLEKAFSDNGYKVVNEQKLITPATILVNSKIMKFWTWMNPGFAAITLSANVEVSVDMLKDGNQVDSFTAEGVASEPFLAGFANNYEKVLNDAYRNFINNVSQHLSELKE